MGNVVEQRMWVLKTEKVSSKLATQLCGHCDKMENILLWQIFHKMASKGRQQNDILKKT